MGIWCGDSKPPLNEFLEPLISELDDMLVNGISINGQNISVKFGRAPCDTPARSHMKNNKINIFIYIAFSCTFSRMAQFFQNFTLERTALYMIFIAFQLLFKLKRHCEFQPQSGVSKVHS